MPFPVKRAHEDSRGLFVVQDPDLRAAILPLFSFDPRQPGERPVGHGTAFRIDPWGNCATAFHVIEDLVHLDDGNAVLRDDIRLAALEFEGLGYGRAPLPRDCWRPFSELGAICGMHSPPVGELRMRNVTELARISIERSADAVGRPSFLSMDLRSHGLEVGARIQALGFADLDVAKHGEGDARAMSQYLWGSEAKVVVLQGPDPTRGRPWPIFRVEADWPGGMSGGPVFNEEGYVIGIVSTGMASAGIGTATSFVGWNAAVGTFPSLDPSNRGWLRCWAALDQSDDIVELAAERDVLQTLLEDRTASTVAFVSVNPKTGDHMRVN
jgi:serine protease Do